MKYKTHIQNIKTNFPDLDLLKETEFGVFENEEFAILFINSCINLCENASKKLNINLSFAVKFDYTFNATAKVKNQYGVIIFNIGLIEKLETIILDSIKLFLSENIASLTIQENLKNELKQILRDCCISYLFYHELAHILQLFETVTNDTYDFQEKYSNEKSFDVKKHIYEIDADLFGSTMSAIELIKNAKNIDNQFNTIIMLNSLTAVLFCNANIIIEYSGNLFQKIYYKKNSHPHPFIRIVNCNEQILHFISKNLTIANPFYEYVLQRTGTMISQIKYSNNRIIDYPKFYQENSIGIEAYIAEIEEANEIYTELIRFKSQKWFNTFIE